MEQRRLAIYDDETDALRDLVQGLGGTKIAASALRPDLAADRAGAWLKDCLNPERPERLQPSQLFHLLRLGREKQLHGPVEFIMAEIGYKVTPIEPQDQLAELQREFIQAADSVRGIAERIERLTKSPLQAIK